jgi:hypothetical protein
VLDLKCSAGIGRSESLLLGYGNADLAMAWFYQADEAWKNQPAQEQEPERGQRK